MKKNTHNSHVGSLAMLSQLAGMLDCSLARYLSNARPWSRRPYLLLDAVTRRLAYVHERHAGAIVRLLQARRYNVSSYIFPMEFTYYNDLDLEYLAPRVLDDQIRLIAFATKVATELAGDRDYEAQRLIEKLLASLCEYSAILKELLAPHRIAPRAQREEDPAAKTPSGSRRGSNRPERSSTQPQTAA